MFNFKVNTKEIDELLASSVRSRRVANAINRVSVYGENELKDRAKKIQVTSLLANSIDSKLNTSSVRVTGNIRAKANYAYIALESGRAPGKGVPASALYNWVQKRGLANSENYKGVAIAVARKIKERGTRKWREKKPQYVTEVVGLMEKYINEKTIDSIFDALFK